MHRLTIKHSWSQCFQKYFTSYLLYTVPQSCTIIAALQGESCRPAHPYSSRPSPEVNCSPKSNNELFHAWEYVSYRGRLILHGSSQRDIWSLSSCTLRVSGYPWHVFFSPCFVYFPTVWGLKVRSWPLQVSIEANEFLSPLPLPSWQSKPWTSPSAPVLGHLLPALIWTMKTETKTQGDDHSFVSEWYQALEAQILTSTILFATLNMLWYIFSLRGPPAYSPFWEPCM